MEGILEFDLVGECLVGKIMSFDVAPSTFDLVQFRRRLWQRSTRSQCARDSRAFFVALLTWMGPLSTTITAGFLVTPVPLAMGL